MFFILYKTYEFFISIFSAKDREIVISHVEHLNKWLEMPKYWGFSLFKVGVKCSRCVFYLEQIPNLDLKISENCTKERDTMRLSSDSGGIVRLNYNRINYLWKAAFPNHKYRYF